MRLERTRCPSCGRAVNTRVYSLFTRTDCGWCEKTIQQSLKDSELSPSEPNHRYVPDQARKGTGIIVNIQKAVEDGRHKWKRKDF